MNGQTSQDYDSIEYQNNIISSHNATIVSANEKGIQFWRDSDNLDIYYRINPFGKSKKLKNTNNLYSILNIDTLVKFYDDVEKVDNFTNILVLIGSYLSTVNYEIFYPRSNLEWIEKYNIYYKNIFNSTSYLKKMKRDILPIDIYIMPTPNYLNNISFGNIKKSISNEFGFGTPVIQNLNTFSIILHFLQITFEKQENYIMNWISYFFHTLTKTGNAIVLIGDKKTTDLLIYNIIKPIFALKNEYFCTINDEILMQKDNSFLKDKIFYHIDTDDLSKENIKSSRLSDIVRKLLKPNPYDIVQALENNETYIHGETIVTSSQNTPYPFLKDSYSKCTVIKVKNLENILKDMDMDLITLEDNISRDLDNFTNTLAQYQVAHQIYILDNEEKKVLPKMKNGILMTTELKYKIRIFIQKIKENKSNKSFIKPLKKDPALYEEFIHNMKEGMIAQPLLSTYFNMIYNEVIFKKNSDFIEVLKEMDNMFEEAPKDNSKYNNKKRYKIKKNNIFYFKNILY